jgi:hypothetical protein
MGPDVIFYWEEGESKWHGHDADHLPPSNAESRMVELYSPSHITFWTFS